MRIPSGRAPGGNLLRQPGPGHAVVPPIDPRPVTLEGRHVRLEPLSLAHDDRLCAVGLDAELWRWAQTTLATRSEEHTSELQSQSNHVCRLLLEKKKKNK